MTTTAIIPDFDGFQWERAPNPSFEVDPVLTDPLYELLGCRLSAIPDLPLTQPPTADPRSSEPHETKEVPSPLAGSHMGYEDLLAGSEQMLQLRNCNQDLDSAVSDINQTTTSPPKPLTTDHSHQLDKMKASDQSTSLGAKMRSASRRPKKTRKKLILPAHVLQARECHNNVEKQYRTRLKLRFERLLAVLEASRAQDKYRGEGGPEAPEIGYSRGEVLDAARQRILTLEAENRDMSTQIKDLKEAIITQRVGQKSE
ncbi:Allergen Fus c 3 [Fusarium beomiforme]|uniref:Allergen Fus c 3 n=1 Tax=Fusarium beomiforme TaxID=44412 RepID=A0A9P5A6Q7_9HYPO|nr:Allergen Fus c 3 [Fusarium beomiforme]